MQDAFGRPYRLPLGKANAALRRGGLAPLASATVVVAARPRPPLQLAALRQPPTAEGLPAIQWGFLIVAKGE